MAARRGLPRPKVAPRGLSRPTRLARAGRNLLYLDHFRLGPAGGRCPTKAAPEGLRRKRLEQLRQALRTKHYSLPTEECYARWAEPYIRSHKGADGFRHANTMGAAEVEPFLTHLAVAKHVWASTQNQALNALVFLYPEVLRQERTGIDAARARRLPVVLSRDEARQPLEALDRLPTTEPYPLMDLLMDGAGLWLMECCRLRVQNVDSCQRSLMLAIHCWLSIIDQPGVNTSCL
jgi:hypothetical protein